MDGGSRNWPPAGAGGKPFDGAPDGNDADGDFGLAEECALEACETQITCQHELIADAPGASPNCSDAVDRRMWDHGTRHPFITYSCTIEVYALPRSSSGTWSGKVEVLNVGRPSQSLIGIKI